MSVLAHTFRQDRQETVSCLAQTWTIYYQIKITHALSGTAMESHPRDHIFLFQTFWPHSELKSQRMSQNQDRFGAWVELFEQPGNGSQRGRVDCFGEEWLPWDTLHHPTSPWLPGSHRAASSLERKECVFQLGLAPLHEEGFCSMDSLPWVGSVVSKRKAFWAFRLHFIEKGSRLHHSPRVFAWESCRNH